MIFSYCSSNDRGALRRLHEVLEAQSIIPMLQVVAYGHVSTSVTIRIRTPRVRCVHAGSAVELNAARQSV